MYCPFCGHIETKVTDSRLAGEGRWIDAPDGPRLELPAESAAVFRLAP